MRRLFLSYLVLAILVGGASATQAGPAIILGDLAGTSRLEKLMLLFAMGNFTRQATVKDDELPEIIYRRRLMGIARLEIEHNADARWSVR